MKAVFSVFSITYLINKEPIRINGKTGKEFITSLEKSPKKVEESLIVFNNRIPINIANPANPTFTKSILKSAKILMLNLKSLFSLFSINSV